MTCCVTRLQPASPILQIGGLLVIKIEFKLYSVTLPSV